MTKLELTKFDSLKEIYSEKYIELLKQKSMKKSISYETICSKLPNSDLIKIDKK